MTKRLAFVKKFIETHKVAIAVGMTATAFLLLIQRNQREFNNFLAEHNLLDEFYAIED